MWRKHGIVLSAILGVSAAGCGGSAETDGATGGESAKALQPPPAAAVAEFLEAMRAGDDEKTAQMLTKAARATVAELEMHVSPPGSDTAEFEIGEVQYLAEDGARVACTLSDLDENSQRHSEDVIWMVRREAEGWRIAGVAATVVPGEPPQAINFEDRQQMAAMKQSQQRHFQARQQDSPESSIRR